MDGSKIYKNGTFNPHNSYISTISVMCIECPSICAHVITKIILVQSLSRYIMPSRRNDPAWLVFLQKVLLEQLNEENVAKSLSRFFCAGSSRLELSSISTSIFVDI
ncbi:hypothetical protein CDAR_545131 [Caerostris darwini]|uniref:Uncharacterized protein n=1 Tax=Caerostris darwini TaxID=1538125 RepID=A0AAV4TG47_9ARAC|nr:hypothetical protein CDAR_545131 [Caerostris darwini]